MHIDSRWCTKQLKLITPTITHTTGPNILEIWPYISIHGDFYVTALLLDTMDDQERNFVSNANLENGYDGHNRVRPDYLQDFTYRVIPLCAVILVFFSDGAILICTLAFDRPLPRKGVIVVSGMLAVFFAIFGIGGMFIYRRRYHPPLSKDPNCPGRTLRSRSGSRQGRMRKAATWVTSVAKATERYVKTRWSKMPVAEETSSQRNSPSRDDRPLARPPNEDDRLTVEHIEPVDFVSLRYKP